MDESVDRALGRLTAEVSAANAGIREIKNHLSSQDKQIASLRESRGKIYGGFTVISLIAGGIAGWFGHGH